MVFKTIYIWIACRNVKNETKTGENTWERLRLHKDQTLFKRKGRIFNFTIRQSSVMQQQGGRLIFIYINPTLCSDFLSKLSAVGIEWQVLHSLYGFSLSRRNQLIRASCSTKLKYVRYFVSLTSKITSVYLPIKYFLITHLSHFTFNYRLP